MFVQLFASLTPPAQGGGLLSKAQEVLEAIYWAGFKDGALACLALCLLFYVFFLSPSRD